MTKYRYYIPAKNVYKPWIKVGLGYKRTHRVTVGQIVALVDSGADVCFCLKEISDSLGVKTDKKNAMTFTTANQTTFEGYKEALTLYVAGKRYECPFYIADKLPHQTPIILGQVGFFDHFKITFDLQGEEIELVYNFNN